MTTPKLEHEFKIYFGDTDYGRVVYLTNYLRFAEQAKMDLYESLGINEIELDEKEDVGFIVKEVNIDYKKPLTLGDIAFVKVTITKLKALSVEMVHEIINKSTNDIAATVSMTSVCVNSKSLKPTRMPKWIHEGFESLVEHETV